MHAVSLSFSLSLSHWPTHAHTLTHANTHTHSFSFSKLDFPSRDDLFSGNEKETCLNEWHESDRTNCHKNRRGRERERERERMRVCVCENEREKERNYSDLNNVVCWKTGSSVFHQMKEFFDRSKTSNFCFLLRLQFLNVERRTRALSVSLQLLSKLIE